MWALIIKAFGGAFLTAIFNAFRLRRLDRERDENIIGRRDAEQRAANAEAQTKITKDMLDAQVLAPASRTDFADRLRHEAAAETGAAPQDK